MPRVLPPNEELVLTRWVRARLAGTPWSDALVTNRLTRRGDTETPPAEDFAVVVRGDGGPALQQPTFSRRVGIRVLGPDGDDNAMRTSELARLLAALLPDACLDTPEIAATPTVSGPHRVPAELGRPELYLTAELILVGSPIT